MNTKLRQTFSTVLTNLIINLESLKYNWQGSSHGGSMVTSPTGIQGDGGSIPGLAQWVQDSVLPWPMV